jgi:purine-nucleoside phosphorylase
MSVVEQPRDEHEAAEAVRRRLGNAASRVIGGDRPAVAVVLGSGLGDFGDRVREQVRIGYADLPHFPTPTVAGHRGELVTGWIGPTPVLVFSGRFHPYEGHTADVTALPVRMAAALGADTVVVTNAAGSLRPTLRPGAVMAIADHINLTGRNPLAGPVRQGETRFPDMSEAYDVALRALANDVARRLGMPLPEGVYAGLLGPSYETPAEIRFVGRIGADAVGMSTVLEVIAARGRGLRCLGLSAITNFAAGVATVPLRHADVLAVAAEVSGRLGDLLEGILTALPPAGAARHD